jgi:hypothetical protein
MSVSIIPKGLEQEWKNREKSTISRYFLIVWETINVGKVIRVNKYRKFL